MEVGYLLNSLSSAEVSHSTGVVVVVDCALHPLSRAHCALADWVSLSAVYRKLFWAAHKLQERFYHWPPMMQFTVHQHYESVQLRFGNSLKESLFVAQIVQKYF